MTFRTLLRALHSTDMVIVAFFSLLTLLNVAFAEGFPVGGSWC